MVKKPHQGNRPDVDVDALKGWFSILLRGKKTYVNEILQREKEGHNPQEKDNEIRCCYIAWEMIVGFFTSREFHRFMKSAGPEISNWFFNRLNDYGGTRDLFHPSRHDSPSPWFEGGREINWDALEQITLGDKCTSEGVKKLLEISSNLSEIYKDLGMNNNYFSRVHEFLESCLHDGPLAYSAKMPQMNPNNQNWHPVKRLQKVRNRVEGMYGRDGDEPESKVMQRVRHLLPKDGMKSKGGLADDMPNVALSPKELEVWLKEYVKLSEFSPTSGPVWVKED